MINNTSTHYGWLAIFFHWLSALTVFGLFAVGLWMVGLDYYSEWYRDAPHYHKSVGLLLSILIIVRLAWKLKQPTPQPFGSANERLAAKLAHGVMYVFLFAIFSSGYLISTADGRSIEVFNWFNVPSLGELFANQEDLAGNVHEWLAYILIGTVVIHALAALKHHFINKDKTLVRMLSPEKSGQNSD